MKSKSIVTSSIIRKCALMKNQGVDLNIQIQKIAGFKKHVDSNFCQYKHDESTENSNSDKTEEENSIDDKFEVQELVCETLCVDCESWHIKVST